jgi:uridine nucleosidase
MHSILFDTDPGVDDAMALLLALRSPEIQVVGVTTIFGNSNIEATTRNALNLLHFADRADIPVARGASVPLVLPHSRSAEFVHGPDAMGGIGWDSIHRPGHRAMDASAANFIVKTVMERPGEITLVAIGPLTNLALALQLEPRVAQAVKQVVIMGGTIVHPGNCSPVAEANIANDPHAAQAVFTADWDLTVAPLDVTHATTTDHTFYARLRASKDPFAQFISQITPFYQRFYASRDGNTTGSIPTHDPSAIAYLIDPTLFTSEAYAIQVPTEGLAIGATIADRQGRFYTHRKARCLLSVDSDRLRDLLFERLTSCPTVSCSTPR